jgi:hypothetical protein
LNSLRVVRQADVKTKNFAPPILPIQESSQGGRQALSAWVAQPKFGGQEFLYGKMTKMELWAGSCDYSVP